MIHKHTPVRSKKLRQSARGMPCTIRVPCVCNHDPETSVLAHVNGGGMGTKQSDLAAAVACSACHSWLDGGYAGHGISTETRDAWHLQGVVETLQYWYESGLIGVK